MLPLTKIIESEPDVESPRVRSRSVAAESVSTGKLLVASGLISAQQLDICLRQQNALLESSGRTVFIEQLLVNNRFCTQAQISKILGQDDATGQGGLLLPVPLCVRLKIFPMRISNGVMDLKSAMPLSERQLSTIRAASGVSVTEIRLVPTDLADIAAALSSVMSSEHSFDTMLDKMKSGEISGVLLRQSIQAMLMGSVAMRASDIHLDKKPDPEAWLSHRVDGLMTQSYLIPERIMAALFTKIKTECGMDASDDRRAQDGRISVENHGRRIDFRVATQPVVGGEAMTLRVLDPESLLGLDTLFPNQPDMTALFQSIARINGKKGGLIIFSGPTGSGKTTSLYALAQQFPRDAINLITVEDPVEYVLPFTRQIQLNQLLNEQSMNVERSMLRQDPDIIILGEIRDADTMRAALKFAESGHLVLASIHADNVTQTFQRVMSFVAGESKDEALFMLANTLRVVVNQRLVRRLCTCGELATPEQETEIRGRARKLEISLPAGGQLMHRRGCPRCRNSGYYGRAAAHETVVIPLDEKLRSEITGMMFESMGNFAKVKDLPGVTYKSRQDTVGRLASAGIIDMPTAERAVAEEFV